MLIDELLPDYEFSETHVTRVAAGPDDVFRSISELTPAEIPLFRVLLTVRSLPGMVSGGTPPRFAADQPLVEQALDGGFVQLAKDPKRELVLGTIGQFWKLRSRPVPIVTKQEFLAFDRPGYAKAAMNFRLSGDDPTGTTRVRTETRVSVPDRDARRRFAVYWLVVRWPSGLIRRLWLRALKRRAERN